MSLEFDASKERDTVGSPQLKTNKILEIQGKDLISRKHKSFYMGNFDIQKANFDMLLHE